MARFEEDESFPFGGYTRSTWADVIEGDGVRLDEAVPGQYMLVEAISVAGRSNEGPVFSVIMSDRKTAVANVMADALGRPLEGMGADPQLQGRQFRGSDVVWIRL